MERVCNFSYFRDWQWEDSQFKASMDSDSGLARRPRKGWSWCFSLELSVWGWMPIGCYVEWSHGSVFNMVFKSLSPLLILPFDTLRWYSLRLPSCLLFHVTSPCRFTVLFLHSLGLCCMLPSWAPDSVCRNWLDLQPRCLRHFRVSPLSLVPLLNDIM